MGIRYADENIEVLRFGFGSFDSFDYEFTVSERVIGFYGSTTEEYISELGFLTYDPKCVITIPDDEVVPTSTSSHACR